MFKKISSLLREIHSDNQDNLSWTRIISSIIILNVMVVWDVECLKTHSFVEFTTNQFMLIVTVLGIKVGNKLVEEASIVKQKSLSQDQ